jgi:hypothetical protein
MMERMPLNWNPYFPWYLAMPPMMVAVGNFHGGRKLLNYPKSTKNLNLNTHKSRWCHPGRYKNYFLPIDVVGHNFDLGGQLCEYLSKVYF